MANKQITKNLRDGTITIKDSGGTNNLELVLDEGNLTFTDRDNANVILDRGTLDHMRLADEEPVEITFSAKFVAWEGESATPLTPSIPDALRKVGNASSWVSTKPNDVYCVDLEFLIVNPETAEKDETLTFADFHADEITFAEGDEFNTISVTGKALIVRPASAYS